MWSKTCHTCGKKIFWQNSSRMFVEFDDDQKGTHRHLCPLNDDTKKVAKQQEPSIATSEQVDSIQRKLISIESNIAMLSKALLDTRQAVFAIQGKLA